MDSSSDYISLIVFALLAVVVVWKLYAILGARTDDGPKGPPLKFQNRDGGAIGGLPSPDSRLQAPSGDRQNLSQPPHNNLPETWTSYFEPDGTQAQERDHLRMADPHFDPAVFLDGAAKAYEIIVEAFASGDREPLQRLLSSDVFQTFDTEIRRSEAGGETRFTTIVALQPPKIVRINLENGLIQLAVRFNSKLISGTRNKEGDVVNVGSEAPSDHMDLWTFSRAINSSDPNWKLVATQS